MTSNRADRRGLYNKNNGAMGMSGRSTPARWRYSVTVGITSYNAASTLARAVLSALTQNVTGWCEILVVDDASTDGSSELITDWERMVPALRAVKRKTNCGVGAARNTLLDEARGDFIVFFDDDDVSVAHRVNRQIAQIRQSELGSLGSGREVVSSSARLQRWPDGVLQYEPTIRAEDQPASPEEMIELVFLSRPINGYVGACATCSQAGRTELYKRAGGFDSGLRRGEDTDMNVRLARAGAFFGGISEPLVYQTVTEGEEKGLDSEELAALRWVNTNRCLLRDRGIEDFVESWFRLKFALSRRQHGVGFRSVGSLMCRHPGLLARRLCDYAVAARNAPGRPPNWFVNGSL